MNKKIKILLTLSLLTPLFRTAHAYDTRPLAVASILTLGAGAIGAMYASDDQQRKVAGTTMIIGLVGLFASAAFADQPPAPEACNCVCHTQPHCKQWTNWLFRRWAQHYRYNNHCCDDDSVYII